MLRRAIGLLICVVGVLSIPLYASARTTVAESVNATPCESLSSWEAVKSATTHPVPGGQDVWVQGGPYRLFARAYEAKALGVHPTLVVVLHGDGPPPYQFPNYQYTFASKVVAENQNVVVVGLLRPGYTDARNHHSQGCSGQRDGDNWDAQNTDAIADAIAALKNRYRAREVIVAGHSGGAAIAANILGRRPKLIDAALLVSCPCGDVNRWRAGMLQLTGFSVFKGDIQSLSPIDQIKGIDPHVPIVMMTGTADHVAPLAVAERYRSAAVNAGKEVTLVELPGRSHNTFIYPEVFAKLHQIIRHAQLHDAHSPRQDCSNVRRRGARRVPHDPEDSHERYVVVT